MTHLKITPKFIHSCFSINGHVMNLDKLTGLGMVYLKEGDAYQKNIGEFLLDWLDSTPYVKGFTSGSTGVPKEINLSKQAMVNSALATGKYFKIKPKSTSLCCMSTNYISGKMMLVRAMILGQHLDIIEPVSIPLSPTTKNYDFAAMIPMQAMKSYSNLNKIKTLILGGGALDYDFERDLQNVDTKVYITYGMTETVSHVAIRKVNHTKKLTKEYKAMDNVSFSVDARNCLVIDAPSIADERVVTNDVVDLISDKKFVWVGRIDNVINSGGIKIFPEDVERRLQKYISDSFFIAKEDDPVFSQIAVLYLQTEDIEKYKTLIKNLHNVDYIKRYEIPKKVYCVPRFVLTENGKLRREETINKYSGIAPLPN